MQVARSLKPSGGVALERGQRGSGYQHDSRTLPFATGQVQAWDASLVGTGVAYCSDRTAPAGQEWTCGEIVRSLGSQKFELRLAGKQKFVVKLPVPNVRYLPVKSHADAPPAAPPPLQLRPAATALQLLQSASAGGAAEAVVAECLRALSAKETRLVQQTWAEPHDDSEVPCPGHNHPVTRSHFAAVRPCTDSQLGRQHWLPDTILNPLCLLLRAALGRHSKVVIFTSHLGTLLMRADYRITRPVIERELRAFANVKLFEQLQWLMIIHLKKHWFVVQVVFLHLTARLEPCTSSMRCGPYIYCIHVIYGPPPRWPSFITLITAFSCRWTLSSSRLWPTTRCPRKHARQTALRRYVQCIALCLTFTFSRRNPPSTGLGGGRRTCASAIKAGLTGTTAASLPTCRYGALRGAPPSLYCRTWHLQV